MLIERGNGSTWTQSRLPVIGVLTSVSCASATTCVAVGTRGDASSSVPFAARWNGSTWTSETVPNPSGTGTLTGIACPTATWCVAVGEGPTRTMRLVRNSTTWGVQSQPANVDYMAVACASRTSCVTVGEDELHGLTYAEQFDGTSWVAQPTPGDGSYSAVTCVSTVVCDAVGSDSAAAQPIAARWDGTAWSAQAVPTPSGLRIAGLTGVACGTGSTCVAVGDAWTANDPAPLALRSNGTSWTTTPVPPPNGAVGTVLGGVACAGAGECFAAGGSGRDVGSDVRVEPRRPLVERWNGSNWVLAPGSGTGPAGILHAVTCATATACFAVGERDDGTTLIERWNGTTWSVAASPSPAHTAVQLLGVACGSPTACVAVGATETDDNFDAAFAERWNGTTWSIVAVPTFAAPPYVSWLRAASCISATDCWAGGGATNGRVLLEHWNGSAWSFAPQQSTPGDISGVSCVAANGCVAVGDGIVEQWNGTSWAPVSSSASDAVRMRSVSCTSMSRCVAVGVSSADETAALRKTGSTWTLEDTVDPFPVRNATSALDGVACVSAVQCIAVGGTVRDLADNSGGWAALIERRA
jgi:hypothetical protein